MHEAQPSRPKSNHPPPRFWLLSGKYYDLSSYFDQHPGSAHALRQTAGRDITELFTSIHLSDLPWKLLPRFEVRDPELLKQAAAQYIPRTGYSMREDGFYMTLRKRVLQMIKAELCENDGEANTSSGQIQARVTKATAYYKVKMFLLLSYYFVAVLFASFFSHEFCTSYFYGAVRSSSAAPADSSLGAPDHQSLLTPEFMKVAIFFGLLWSISYVRSMLVGCGHEAIHRNIVLDTNKGHKMFSLNSLMADFFAESLGFNQQFWIEEHVLQHHIVTGRYGPDPDEDLPLVRLNARETWLFWWSPLNLVWQTLDSLIVLPANLLVRVVESSVTIAGDSLRCCGILKVKDEQRQFKLGREIERIAPEWGASGPHELVFNFTMVLLKQSLVNGLPFIMVALRNHLAWVKYFFDASFLGATAAEQQQVASIPYVCAWFVFAVVTTWSNCAGLHAFHSNHNVEEAKNYGDKKRLPFYPGIDWGEAQMNTTVNFRWHWSCPDSGLEHQIEHHLFPTLSIAHVDKLVPLVKKTAAEFDIPYNEAPSFWTALGWHLKYMVKLGMGLSVPEDPTKWKVKGN